MITNFLYCIDYPAQSDGVTETDRLAGWLLCSRKLLSVEVQNNDMALVVDYGLHRPDVAQHFKSFPASAQSGLLITASGSKINLNKPFPLKALVEDDNGNSVQLCWEMDMTLSKIQLIEIDDEKATFDILFDKVEERFEATLRQHPWLTIRMDITNKCNLKCIMCHYKEETIYSRPTQAITAEELNLKIHDIAPYVKHIMLSCGFEPLMSKHFHNILKMLHTQYPHIEIAFCTNAMLLNSRVRKSIIENDVTHVLFSLDGVTSATVERIRVGASFKKIIANISALKNLKLKSGRTNPLMFIDFVLMNSNIHEAPAFVEMCAMLGMDIIDFRHLVGNIFFSEHEEMLSFNKPKYNYFRPLIIEAARKHDIDVRLPEPFDTTDTFTPDGLPAVKLDEFKDILPDEQTDNVIPPIEIRRHSGRQEDFAFMNAATCLRPFNEIMIGEEGKILPCSYYNDAMGWLNQGETLHQIFFGENFKKVRRRKLFGRFDHNCLNCPIMHNLLPTEIVK